MPFVYDTFTGADGTALSAHVGETGATWTKNTSSGYSSGVAQIFSNRVRSSNSSTSVYLASGTPATADYSVEADFTYLAFVASVQCGIVARASASLATMYYFRYLETSHVWQLLKLIDGNSSVILASFSQTVIQGQTYHMKLLCVGSTITAYIDGAQVISVTDSAISGPGYAGCFFATSASQSYALDNFTATNYAQLPPANSGPPAITGTAQEGQTVTCSTGSWTNTPTSYTYQWRRNGSSISGSVSSTYVLASADVGQTITCTVTATNAGGSAGADSNSITPIAQVFPPANSIAPAITGTAQEGSILSCSNGTWTNTPTGYTYQWKRNGTNISTATAFTYVLASADVGQTITCTVTATNAGGSAGADSNSVTPTGVPAPTIISAPVISGSAQTGQTANCTSGQWNNFPAAFTYQWKRDGVIITGATDPSYVFLSGDENHAITCSVTATNTAGNATSTSNSITVLPAPAPGPLSLPVLTGTAKTGAQLFCTAGTWTGNPATFAYQWKRNGTNISGATSRSYVLTNIDEGTSITCTVTASNDSLSTTVTSNAVIPVALTAVGTVAFLAQMPSTGLSGTLGMQVIDEVTEDILIARSTAGIDEVVAGTGIYRALRVTEPPVGSIVIWDDGTTAVGHVTVTRY